MNPASRIPRFSTLLVATLCGVYLLIITGATSALAEAVRACSSWPTCSGSLSDPQIAIAVSHRIVVALVAVSLLMTVIVGLQHSTSRRVKGTLLLAAGLYPLQIAVGGLVATSTASILSGIGPSQLAWLHLLVGTGIFVALALALAWQLEDETGHPDEDRTSTEIDRSSPEIPHDQPTGRLAQIRVRAAAYFRLMKPRLMWLLCLVASAGMALAAGAGNGSLSIGTVVFTLGGGVLSIGASGTFNNVLERDIDQQMARTADRPLVTHQVRVRNALAFGLALTIASLIAFLQVNVLAAALGLVAIAFYSVIYTLILKPHTVQNTVIGGVAGALPALIGWAGVTGRIGIPALALAGLIFLWTPAHFYNLALAYRDDYERGGFPMMPVVRGGTVTRKHIIYYLAATLLAASGLAALTQLGWLYGLATVTLGAVFLWFVVRLHRKQTKRAALRAFHASNAYLGAVLVAVVLDAIVI